MPANHKLKRRLENAAEQCRRLPANTITQVISAQEILSLANRCGVRFRERIFPPFVTLWLFLWQVLNREGSCREAVWRLLLEQGLSGALSKASVKTGGYCQARKRLSLPFVIALYQQVAARGFGQLDDRELWLGRRVKIADGTMVTMPDTPANQETYPQQAGQKPGLGFPIARLTGVFCWSTGALLAHATGPFKGKGASELAQLYTLLDSFEAGDVLLADRFYASYAVIGLLQARGVDVVFRQHQRRKVDFRTGQRLGRLDHVVTMQKPKQCPKWLAREEFERLPDQLKVREVRCGELTVVTTLLDVECYPGPAIVALYQTRWNCELDLRSLKQVLGMDILRCQTPEMVEKEIATYILAYNLLRALLLKAALSDEISPRTVSFKAAQQMLLAQGAALWWCEVNTTVIDALLSALAAERVGDRPGRCEPRAVKRRPKPHKRLTQPRAEARQAVCPHAH